METDPRARPNLSQPQRNTVAQFLLQNLVSKKLRHGAIKEAMQKFGICRRTVHNIWKLTRQQLEEGGPVHLISKKKGTQHGDKKELDVELMKSIPVLQRTSYSKIAIKLKVSKSTVQRWVKQKEIRPHTSAIKPFLTEENKFNRLKWCLKHLDPRISEGKLKFQPMTHTIHIDEKWFLLTKTADRYYLVADEEEPYRTCKSKRFVEKIMFESVVSRPLYASDGTCIFDGKIGIFHFCTLEPAQRNSKNRAKGTLEYKPIQSINLPVMKNIFIKEIVPAIKRKWPAHASKHIIIQQDNAKPHIKPDDPEFIEAANSDGFHITLVCQPANSPDTNINDLGFFRAIQSLKDEKMAKNVTDLMKNVTDAFEEMPTYKLNNVFLTLQGCMIEIMKVRGSNNYKIPHMDKEKHIREGTLPECLEVDEQLVKDCLKHLENLGDQAGDNYNIDTLVQAMHDMEI